MALVCLYQREVRCEADQNWSDILKLAENGERFWRKALSLPARVRR